MLESLNIPTLACWPQIAWPQGTDQYTTKIISIITLSIQDPRFSFLALFIFRYLRTVIHLISFWLFYTPIALPALPKYHPHDCTVLLPTIDPKNDDFAECILSCLTNYPGHIMIVTAGDENFAYCKRFIEPYQHGFPSTKVKVLQCSAANKRFQLAYALRFVMTEIVVLLDDHVFWSSDKFLPTVLAPFQDDTVGGVATNKRVRKNGTGFNMNSFWNMMGALYLDRHNFEIRATNAIDGGVFVVSGRTAIYRASILTSPAFLHGYTTEMFCFGLLGPLHADDDNFITRWVVNHGYKIKVQYNNDALVETTLGTYPKFLSQCVRWARSSWRSNAVSLFKDGTVWYRQLWCVYAVHLSSFFNFALVYDSTLIYTFIHSPLYNIVTLRLLVAWIFLSKMIKLVPYFLRHPEDLCMLPGYLIFAYFHSFIKLYALLTFFNNSWGGRSLDTLKPGSNDPISDDDSDGEYLPSHSGCDRSTSSSSSAISPSTCYDDDDNFDNRLDISDSSSAVNESSTISQRESFYFPTPGPKVPLRRRSPFVTPWGLVSPSNPHAKSANLLENEWHPAPLATEKIHLKHVNISINSNIQVRNSSPPNTYSTRRTHNSVSPRVTDVSDTRSSNGSLRSSPVSVSSVTQSASSKSSPYAKASPKALRSPLTPPISPEPFIDFIDDQFNPEPETTPRLTTLSPKPINDTNLIHPYETLQDTPHAADTTNKALNTKLTRTTTPGNTHSWTRSLRCDRLHSQNHDFRNGECFVPSLFNLPKHIISDRPKM